MWPILSSQEKFILFILLHSGTLLHIVHFDTKHFLLVQLLGEMSRDQLWRDDQVVIEELITYGGHVLQDRV